MYARRQQYDFRLFDQTLFCFTLFRNDFFWERAVIDDVDESCRHLLPLKLFANFNEQTIVSWI